MGWFTMTLAYGIGKRRGSKQTTSSPRPPSKQNKESCSNYYSFCQNYGSCDGMECEYD